MQALERCLLLGKRRVIVVRINRLIDDLFFNKEEMGSFKDLGLVMDGSISYERKYRLYIELQGRGYEGNILWSRYERVYSDLLQKYSEVTGELYFQELSILILAKVLEQKGVDEAEELIRFKGTRWRRMS